MKFKYSVFNFVTAIMFVLAFLCLMVSYATQYMYIPTMVFFEAGFVMLSYILIKSGLKKQQEQDERQEVIVMQLAEGEDGESYVMQSSKQDKKIKRKKRSQFWERFTPAGFSILAAGLILYMIINTIVKLI